MVDRPRYTAAPIIGFAIISPSIHLDAFGVPQDPARLTHVLALDIGAHLDNLARLALGDASVTELAGPFAISQPAISKHLKMLERASFERLDSLLEEMQRASRATKRRRPRATRQNCR
jgi:DNA-binding transcriptional ArsR family regulator